MSQTRQIKLVDEHEARKKLSQLLVESEGGEDIVITRGGKPAVRLVPVGHDRPGIIGLLKGKFLVPNEFDSPLPNDIVELFEGNPTRIT